MRANFNLKRNWSSNFKSIKRLDWSFLIFTLVVLQFIFLFLYFETKSIIWIFIFLFTFLFLFFISWKIILILIPSLILFFTAFYFISSLNKTPNNIEGDFFVIKKISNGIFVQNNGKKFFVETYENLEIDDLVNIKSSQITKIKLDSSFNKYLKSEGVDYIVDCQDISLIGTKYFLRRNIMEYFNNDLPYYSRYVPLIFLGIRNLKNQVIVNKITNISIIHLFTISGFHINILVFLIKKILSFFKIKNRYINLLFLSPLFFYLYLMNFSIAASRAVIFSILSCINKSFLNNKIHKLNLLSIITFLFFVFNPYIVFSYSFIFSFVLSYSILIINSSLNNKNKKMKIFLIALFFSYLINIKLNEEINLTSFISVIIFTPLISFSYILTLLFFWLKPIIDNYYLLIDIIVNFFQYLVLKINVAFSNELIIMLYFISFLSILIFIKKPQLISCKKWWMNNYVFDL